MDIQEKNIKYIEENFGMTLEQWNMLDIEDQKKLLKAKCDNREFIDGVPASSFLGKDILYNIQDFLRNILNQRTKRKVKRNIFEFEDKVLNEHIVTTTIYSNSDVRSFVVKPRSIWHQDAKRGKPVNLDKITGNGYSINDGDKREFILGRIKRK